MTEGEWLVSEDPVRMLLTFRTPSTKSAHDGHISDRKKRLFACACVRQVWHLLTDDRSCRAVEVAERYADGKTTTEELFRVCGLAHRAFDHGRIGGPQWMAWQVTCNDPVRIWSNVNNPPPAAQAALLRDIVGNPFLPVTNWGFTPFPEDGRIIKRIALAVYNERLSDGTLDPYRLLVLADALEEAGCPSEVMVARRVVAGHRCPACGDTGFWRSGQEFDHMKKCRKKGCGKVWVPEHDEYVSETAEPNPLLAHLRSPGPHVRGCHVVDLILGKS